MSIKNFIDNYYNHFNSAALKNAAKAYASHLNQGNKMMITLAGAMSTAEIGKILAEMIRQNKVHAITCTGANLEEDLFNAVAHNFYRKIPNYRDLTPHDEQELVDNHFNRVTDTCIPEEEAIRRIEDYFMKYWKKAEQQGERYFPHQYMYKIILDEDFQKQFQIAKENSWMLEAAKKDLPIYVPGWEDSTLGNITAARAMEGKASLNNIKSGLEYMQHLVVWYQEQVEQNSVGFFQIGGGIAGDFPICAVPLIRQDLEKDVPHWSYFCQITDAQESYGGYSGALPNEKITWDKVSIDTPKFVINSDATIVAPLIFQYVLESDID
jgi:deoxyhypusine synthase